LALQLVTTENLVIAQFDFVSFFVRCIATINSFRLREE
jgi:hypothetical protein